MKTRRKPIIKPLSSAMDALFWRATILLEILEGVEPSNESLLRAREPMRRLQHALEDFEASRFPANGHAQQLELSQ